MVVFDALDELRLAQNDSLEEIHRLTLASRKLELQTGSRPQHEANARADDPATLTPSLDDQSIVGVTVMSALLGYPWNAALQRLDQQAAKHQAVMLSVSANLSASVEEAKEDRLVWRLQAAVKDDALAMQWATSLPLGTLERRDDLAIPFTGPAGTYALKATARATWMTAGGVP